MRQKTRNLELPLEDRGEAPKVKRSGEAGRAARGGARSGVGHEQLMELVVGRENCRKGVCTLFCVNDLVIKRVSVPRKRWTDGSGRRSSPVWAVSTAHWLS